ncbi:helix-turn-helix transcriptional regulator, partial [Ruminococcus sp. KGMB03662]
MFDTFRQNVKRLAKERNLTYAQIAEKSGVKESTIKAFMCGATDSRRVAEKIADVLEVKIVYCNGDYSITTEKGQM